MTKKTKGWKYTKKVILPFTKIEAEMSMPSWANRVQAHENAKSLGKEEEDSIVAKLMLIGCCTFDGEPLDPEDIDDLPVRDAGYLIAEFIMWEAENEKAVKNE